MEFSVIFEGQTADGSRHGEQAMLRQAVEQAVAAEAAGFDRVWAVEHHSLKWFAHMSAPEIFLTWVAAKTSRIRIGHAVVCMPFGYNHPVRVAERAAMLDLLSGGRLDLGAGRGGIPHELSLFGVDGDTTTAEVEEALRMIGHMWQSETFEWDGMLQITPHAVVPRPVQEPHPPLFLACTKHETVVRAAELGVGALVLGFAGPDEIAVTRKLYSDGIASRTRDRLVSSVVNDHFSALCSTVVLDDGPAARRMGLRGQRFFQEASGHYGRGGPEPSADTEDEDNEQAILAIEQSKREANPAEVTVANVRYSTDNAYGDVGRAIDHVTALEELGVDEVMCLVQMGTVPHSACLETLRHWGEEVIPRFR